MTAITHPPTATSAATGSGGFEHTPVKHHPHRWRLARAGFVNVWHYYDTTFDASGGRFILRGTNGSGKSRALEMLLPFLLDADRRNMGTGTAVKMEDLMSAGALDQGNRVGYMWLELRRDDSGTGAPEWLTLGALVKFAASTKEATVQYFTTPLRVHHQLQLIGPDREPLGRRELAELIGDDRITSTPEKHRERVRQEVFGLTGDLGKDRFDGLLKLLHTLRSPDVGNRIEEGKLPVILADALPPLSDVALTEAGAQLDGLTSTRHDQERLQANLELVRAFYGTYRSYIASMLAGSAQAVRSAADAADEAAGTQQRADKRARTLDAQRAELDRQQSDAATRASGLRSELEALHQSSAYRNARELLEKADTVKSLAANADSVLASAETARGAETARAGEADRAAGDLQTDAGTLDRALQHARESLTELRLGTALPTTVACRRDTPRADTAAVRTRRDSDPSVLQRPTADRITFGTALPTVAESLATSGRAAASRRSQAGERRRDAADVENLAGQVARARDDAERLAQTADESRATADRLVDGRDEQAIALAVAWSSWAEQATGHNLTELDPGFDPAAHPALGQVLERSDMLCGPADDDSAALLDGLTGAGRDVTARATEVITERLTGLKAADDLDAGQRRTLEGERAELAAARDKSPSLPPWQSDTGGVPLWRCLDFAPGVPPADRAGIEAALAATGLLTATVEPTGTVVAVDGQVLLTAADGALPAWEALATALTVDDAGAGEPALAAAVRAVLAAVALGDTAADARPGQVRVGRDGSWTSGQLRGRHHADIARHIGAAARAAARAQRICEIDAELALLGTAATARAADRAALHSRRDAITALVRATPSSRPLVQARGRAETADEAAVKANDVAEQARRAADELAVRHNTQEREHRARCEQFQLPTSSADLRAVEETAREAERRCTAATGVLRVLQSALARHDTHLVTLTELTAARTDAEALAEQAWEDWHGPALELATLEKTVGAEAQAVQARIAEAGRERVEAERSARELQEQLGDVGRQAGEAAALARSAADAVDGTRTELAAQVQRLLDQLAEPGVSAAAFADADPITGKFADLTPATVRADVSELTGTLRRTRIDQTALMRARQDFERDVTAYDVNAEYSTSGVWLFHLADNDGRRPLADAAAELAAKVDQGKAALSQREQEVFTRFVLGEVGEELRARINQAGELVRAMNDSLREIRTSHNIGVRLAWQLSEDASGDIAQIKALIARAAPLRTEQQDRELTTLLTARVQAEATVNPTDGYAAHLRAALDYRSWHQIEVTIIGPEEGRTRRLSRRAKLSQGETRFVSYVTLFAAADAYLSGLDDSTSLRLVLLDDAFAKVDDPTIAELLGLLVRLDLDFVMTGHALYGCYPQVPSLDVYEICREDGSPAATAHIHWDGRTRHLRPA